MRWLRGLLPILLLAAPAWAGEPETLRDCPACPEMVVIPAGGFVMGDDAGPDSVRPAKRIVLARPFALARTETTFNQWRACVAAGGCAAEPDDHEWGRGDRPVINVSWTEANAYAAWLSAATGRRYRLPTEAEWEYAARGGTTTAYWWDDEAGEGHANCRHCGTFWSGRQTAPVASFPANPFGLHDMLGNLWEWTAGCWTPDLSLQPADGTAVEAEPCRFRVTRGGAWYYILRLSRVTSRARTLPDLRSYTVGFRVAREIGDEGSENRFAFPD